MLAGCGLSESNVSRQGASETYNQESGHLISSSRHGHLGTSSILKNNARTVYPVRAPTSLAAGVKIQIAPSRRELFLLFVRRASALRTEEELLAIRQSNVAAVGAERAIFRLVAVYNHLGADRNRVLVESAAKQNVGAACFEHPVTHGSIRILHVDMNPGVRIDQLDLGDCAFKMHWSLGVEFRRKRMMRPRRHTGQKQTARGCHYS